MRLTTPEWLQLLQQNKVIAVIRCDKMELAYQMAHAVAAGGIKLIEIAWNSEHPSKIVARLRQDLPNCIIGAGTIISQDRLQEAVLAGAQFAFAPNLDLDLLDVASHLHQIPFVPGVFSPTEIVKAREYGAKAVKVFPIKSLGGAEYINCIRAPLKDIALIPTGGITVDNARTMLDAGAIAVGISSGLFPQKAIAQEDWSSVTDRTKYLLSQLHTK